MEKVITRTASIYLAENDIVHVLFQPNMLVEYEDAVSNAQAISYLSEKKKILLVVNAAAPGLRFHQKAAALAYSKNIPRKYIAIAILINNEKMDQELLSLFNEMTASKVPTRILFEDEYEIAIKWLKSHAYQSAKNSAR